MFVVVALCVFAFSVCVSCLRVVVCVVFVLVLFCCVSVWVWVSGLVWCVGLVCFGLVCVLFCGCRSVCVFGLVWLFCCCCCGFCCVVVLLCALLCFV